MDNKEQTEEKLGQKHLVKKKLSHEDEKALWVRFENGDNEARDELITSHEWLVEIIAKRYCGLGAPKDDLISGGYIGLMKALSRFNYQLGYRFSTYAEKDIKNQIIKALNDGIIISIPREKSRLLARIGEARNNLIQEGIENPTSFQIAERVGIDADKVEELDRIRRFHISLDEVLWKAEDEDKDVNLYDLVPDPLLKDPTEDIEEKEISQILGCKNYETLGDFCKGYLKEIDVFSRRTMMKSMATGSYKIQIPEEVLSLYIINDPFFRRKLFKKISDF